MESHTPYEKPLISFAPYYDRHPDDDNLNNNGVGIRDSVTMGSIDYENVLVFRFGNGGSLDQYSLHNLNGQYDKLSGYIGHVDGGAMTNATINFYGDGILLFTERVLAENTPNYFDFSVDGVTNLKIEMIWPNVWGSVEVAVAAVLE